MSSSLLHPPAHLPPAVALQLSQQAPSLLASKPSVISQYSINSLFSEAESSELWTTYEHLMLSCLRTGDEKSATLCLERLIARFGAGNERLMALKGLFEEATAEDEIALQAILSNYENILAESSSNIVCRSNIALFIILTCLYSLYQSAAYHCFVQWAEYLKLLQLSMLWLKPHQQMRKHGQSWRTCMCRRECTRREFSRWKKCYLSHQMHGM